VDFGLHRWLFTCGGDIRKARIDGVRTATGFTMCFQLGGGTVPLESPPSLNFVAATAFRASRTMSCPIAPGENYPFQRLA
jgi:hypothetical protein